MHFCASSQLRCRTKSTCGVAQIFDLARNTYVKTSDETSAHIRREVKSMRLTASASLFLACELFSSSAQRVDFIDTLHQKRIWRNSSNPFLINLITYYLETRPEPSPFIRFLTSSSVTRFISPSIVCLRQEAATANSIASWFE